MLKGLSLFSSVGIAETYFKQHGIDIKVAAELLEDRSRFYEHLYPEAVMINGDISNIDIYNKIKEVALQKECDFIMATPPCQGMSTAGKQLKDDVRNRLIIHVVEMIKDIKPRFALIENVPEILNTKILIDDEWVLIDDYIKNNLGEDYNFNKTKRVNAMNYNVPQSRERCVYLLSKKSEKFTWEFPNPSDKVLTMRDAIGELPSLDPEVTDITEEQRKEMFPDYYTKREEGLKVSKWHKPPRHKLRHVISMMHTPEGCAAWSNEKYYPTLADGSKSKGYKNTYKRQWWDRPAYTVTKYTSRLGSQENGHPGRALNEYTDEENRRWSDPRVLTIYELMMVSSLPSDWNIPEWASDNLIREVIGECVPPRLLEAAVKNLAKELKNEEI